MMKHTLKETLRPYYAWLRPVYAPLYNTLWNVMYGPKRYAHIFRLIKKHKPQRIMEIGTFNGDRAVAMIQLAQKFHKTIEYYGFDLFENLDTKLFEKEVSKYAQSKQVIEEKLKRTGAAIHLIQGNTTQLQGDVWTALPHMDFVFIDGGHSIETIKSDWEHVQPLMQENTIVVFDDYWPDRTDAGAKPIVDSIDTVAYTVAVLEPTDRFTKPPHAINLALVTKQ